MSGTAELREGLGYLPSRRCSSRSTASRMNSARFPGAASASMRASISADSLTAVNCPIGGRPMRGALSVIFFSAKTVISRYRLLQLYTLSFK